MTGVDDRKSPDPARRLFVAWQDPETRSIEPVAMLTRIASEAVELEYVFDYLVRALSLPGFEPFTAFPDFHRRYYSRELFPFFANRLFARKRPDYEAMMSLLDLGVEAEPFEVLARSGARRETDRLEIFPEPTRDPEGRASCMFFVRGLRYFAESDQIAEDLKENEELRILCDIQNPVNRDAMVLAKVATADLKPLGYLPDYLVAHAQATVAGCGPNDVRVSVVHVNARTAPRHMRVLCRISSCWPAGYVPFTDAEYQAVTETSGAWV